MTPRHPPSGLVLDPWGDRCPECAGPGEPETREGRLVIRCARCGVVAIPRRPPTESERASAEADEAATAITEARRAACAAAGRVGGRWTGTLEPRRRS